MDPIPNVILYDVRSLHAEVLLEGLRSSLDNLSIVGVHDVNTLKRTLASNRPLVVVISAVRESGGGLPLLAQLYSRSPLVPFVVLVPAGRMDRMVDAFRAGAKGVLYDDEHLAQLVKCIQCVARGEVWARRHDLSLILDAIVQPETAAAAVTRERSLLTKREQQVVHLVSQGLSNREVSRSLKIAESTVKNYISHVFEKVGVTNRVELVRYLDGRASEGDRREARPSQGRTRTHLLVNNDG